MASYYMHRLTKSREIPYSFECEHCGKNSGLLTAKISEEAEYKSLFKELKEAENKKINDMAFESLKKRVNTDYVNATDKHIFSLKFKDECPNCHKPQSWGISGMKNNLSSTPIAIIVVGIIVSVLAYIYDANYLMLSFIIGGIAVVAAVAVVIYKLINIKMKTKQLSSSKQNLPNIDWSVAKDLINTR